MSLACVLISDVTGSTGLFERLDNATALHTVDHVLERMRALIAERGGHCVKARGDDILSFFDAPEAAFDAAWNMVNEPWDDGLSVHAGIYFGEILSHENDIYGNAVNTAARLASLAKAGEILLGETCHSGLSAAQRARCLDIGALPLRGKGTPTRVFACSVPAMGEQTQVMGHQAAARPPLVFAAFSRCDKHWHLEEGGALRLGRAPDCDILLDLPTVSRSHGALSIRNGQLEYTDHSSVGTILRLDNGKELTVHRRTTLLSGSGAILPGGDPSGQGEGLTFSLGEIEAR